MILLCRTFLKNAPANTPLDGSLFAPPATATAK
jgi:hypothetical protein